ncbi:MAG: hypothetical protein RJA63_2402 [Pseudomonadota bacterium]
MCSTRSQPDFTALEGALGEAAASFSVEYLARCTSTNALLLRYAAEGARTGLTLWAEEQTAGRGRRGRRWHSAPGHSLTFSVLWQFGKQVPVSGLSLAVGLAVAEALQELGCEGVGLKWPNDIWLLGHKLGGVLTELVFEKDGFQAVIGIGLNVRRHPAWEADIEQTFETLDAVAFVPSREVLLGTILKHLGDSLSVFERGGFEPLCRRWNQLNALYGLPVRVLAERSELTGVCGKALPCGALELVQDDGARVEVSSGDVSLRIDTNL